MRGKGPRKLGNFVPTDISRGLHQELGQVYRLYQPWSEAVGEQLALHSRPLGYADGCLTVQADSPVWATALRQQQRSIQASLQNMEGLEKLKDIRIRISPGHTILGPAGSIRRPAAPVSSTAVESIARTAEVIEDEDLKNALKKLQETTGGLTKSK